MNSTDTNSRDAAVMNVYEMMAIIYARWHEACNDYKLTRWHSIAGMLDDLLTQHTLGPEMDERANFLLVMAWRHVLQCQPT